MVKPETPPDPPGSSGPEDASTSAEYRHRFARRWKRKREMRATRHAWKIILLDLALLLVVVLLTWLLARALE